jgi:hypothetical protein
MEIALPGVLPCLGMKEQAKGIDNPRKPGYYVIKIIYDKSYIRMI